MPSLLLGTPIPDEGRHDIKYFNITTYIYGIQTRTIKCTFINCTVIHVNVYICCIMRIGAFRAW